MNKKDYKIGLKKIAENIFIILLGFILLSVALLGSFGTIHQPVNSYNNFFNLIGNISLILCQFFVGGFGLYLIFASASEINKYN